MPAQAVLQFIYPKTSASTFNMDYYLNRHWPLVEELWGPQGLLSWSVATGDKDTNYHVQAIVFWESLGVIENLTNVDEVMGDVKNFTDATPKKWVGAVVGGSKKIQG
ncbi:hypothetical protein BKA65DRAFT_496269 [Rhexocercosporidium sp. MPI-PUGE-AT-0058]|nr:hypothetical protein BKA65DRAFT_496269 [Rhexocercosporidium sp. MPI-PUGE-AT-0058]